MLLHLLVASLAVFWAWEALLSAFPWTIPPWLQPLLVVGGSLAFCWPDWRLAMAAAGAVGLLHVLVRGASTAAAQASAVRLRHGVGRRVPDLP